MTVTDSRPNIWQLQARYDISGLEKALQHEDASIRKRVAAALRALDRPEAIPALQTALEKERNLEARLSMQMALNDLSQQSERASEQDAAVKTLLRELTDFSGNQNKMIEVIRELGKLKNKLAAEPLIVLFNDLSVPSTVRLEVAETLIKLESAPTVVTLLVALRHPQWRIRRNAAGVLGQLRADWAIAPLGKALVDDNDVVRRTAEAALINIGNSESQTMLQMAEKGRVKTKPLRPRNLDRVINKLPSGDDKQAAPTNQTSNVTDAHPQTTPSTPSTTEEKDST